MVEYCFIYSLNSFKIFLVLFFIVQYHNTWSNGVDVRRLSRQNWLSYEMMMLIRNLEKKKSLNWKIFMISLPSIPQCVLHCYQTEQQRSCVATLTIYLELIYCIHRSTIWICIRGERKKRRDRKNKMEMKNEIAPFLTRSWCRCCVEFFGGKYESNLRA